MSDTTKMTLDEAVELFDASKDRTSTLEYAADLLRVATQYFLDEMIGHEEFKQITDNIADHIESVDVN